MKKFVKILSLILALTMVVGIMASCAKKDSDNTSTRSAKDETTTGEATSGEPQSGDNTPDNPDTNPEPVAAEATEEDVYNEWWRLYIQRWNYLVPEIPLYSNQYFDIYNAKFENFKTSPYWGARDAIIATTVKSGEQNSAIIGSSTDLSGMFRNASWGKSSPAASDNDIQTMTSGYATEASGFDGAYTWNMQALAEEPVKTMNEDGTLTYTIKVRDDMKFSDGTPINAKNYIVALLSNSTKVAQEGGGSGMSGLQLVGYDAFFEGTAKEFEGVKLLDDYTFSVTFSEDYATYYYAYTYAAYTPDPLQLYLGSKGEIVVNPDTKACGLNEAFYEKDAEDKYVVGKEITENMKWDSPLPYSGPYTVQNYDESNKIATLKINPNYPGDDQRGKPSIETITYVKVIEETQMDQFQNGEVDIIAGITGGDETKAALKVVNDNPTKYAETHYDRAGYGKLGFRCDYGPTMFTSVRQAIMYTINRNEFAQTFTGGFGSVVHGPYYKGYSAYKAVEDVISLNEYNYSESKAIKVLEDDGWTFNSKGEAFTKGTDDVRYRKLSGHELTEENKAFKTVDGKYSTVKIGDDYYMPLAINYYGTQPNTVTDQLITAWQSADAATKNIGMYIQYLSTEFIPGLYGDFCHYEGYWDGEWKLNAINFATSFSSALYDFAFNWTLDPAMYDDYSAAYLKDDADFWADYQSDAAPAEGARTDNTSVYDKIGTQVTIDMVEEDENGLAYVTVDGIKYELGMDFLSMAMVYRTEVPADWAPSYAD